MNPMHRNGLKGHQHIAQGIALGRRTIVKFALKGHKPYHASLCFCPCRAPLLRFALTQDDALGYQKCTTENLSDLPIPMYIGGAVGLIISIPFGIWNVIKTQRHYQKILDQIEDLKAEFQ